ncbi:uncharacterized protein B0I36DRAFT_311178 [Microdochium trichocladiopsis]|uniref:Pentatricopeptide repeat domain-containing protein n=1 Tax=Microdochium trichocladiopsis TaxID=1682393 RepID=A0A9P8YHT7_9PEZI|nr:uncharacterized protein B0I36DRAFT_311178 [Microdochium trichocladiopsis]KAH7040654.1 hypothetical protein B0I36DRAFT_311178 [Microdochium trichocladiopsis]
MWSRTGQRQSSCLCRGCIHSAKTVARRSTTAATRRRKVTATDLFTACYTTILGTAAIIDAQNKEFRKQDLDDKLEKARTAVNNLTAQNATALAESAAAAASSRQSSTDISSDFLSRIHGLTISQQCAAIYGEQWKSNRTTTSGQTRIDWAGIEKAVAVEHHDPRIKLIEPTSADQLLQVTTTVIDLVEALVAKVERPAKMGLQDQTVQSTILADAHEQQVWQELQSARISSKYPSYEFPHGNPELSADVRTNLRKSLVSAMDGALTPREMVARVCYNLLVSTAPPSITIYNTLIAGFNRLERPDLAQSVVDTVLKNTAGPDTQQTTLCLLNHFRGTNNRRGVRRIAQRMRGVSGSSLHLAELSEPEPSAVTFDGWLHDQAPVERRSNMYLKAAPTTSLSYDTLIRTWLEVSDTDRAAKKFVECIRHDVRIDPQTILRLLRDCVGALDSKAARKLVQGIAKHTSTFIVMIRQLVLDAPASLSLAIFDNLYQLLELSWDTTIYKSGRTMDGFVDFTTRFKPWVFARRLQLQARQAISEADAILDAFAVDRPLLNRVEVALECITPSATLSQNSTLWQRAVTLSAVQSHFDHLTSKTIRLSSQVQHLVIKYKTGVDFDPFGDLDSTRVRERARQLVLADALDQVLLRDTMTAREVKEDLVAGLPDAQQADAFKQAGIAGTMSIGNLTRFYGPRQRHLATAKAYTPQDNAVATLQASFTDRLRSVKALLYGSLCSRQHRLLTWKYSDWNDVPLKLLVKMNLQRLPKPKGAGLAPGRTSRPAEAAGGHIDKAKATESRLKPNPTPKPLPAGIEVSPIGLDIRRTWNPPPRKSWAQPTESAGTHRKFYIDPLHQSSDSTRIVTSTDSGRMSATA